jgi:hypothetical protein
LTKGDFGLNKKYGPPELGGLESAYIFTVVFPMWTGGGGATIIHSLAGRCNYSLPPLSNRFGSLTVGNRFRPIGHIKFFLYQLLWNMYRCQ